MYTRGICYWLKHMLNFFEKPRPTCKNVYTELSVLSTSVEVGWWCGGTFSVRAADAALYIDIFDIAMTFDHITIHRTRAAGPKFYP